MAKFKPVAAGIVIDVSLENVETTKLAIINTIQKLGTQSYTEDRIYVYHPEFTRIPTTRGAQTASAFYFSKIDNLDIESSLKQTTYVVGYEESDMRKHVIFVTDKYNLQEAKLKKPLYLDKKEMFNCKFHFIGIGEQNFPILEDFPNVEFTCVDLFELETLLLEILQHETIDESDSDDTCCYSIETSCEGEVSEA